MQIESTSCPSPTTSRAPRLACRTRSMPSRSGSPGATSARASAMAELGRTTTPAWYPAMRAAIRGRPGPTAEQIPGVPEYPPMSTAGAPRSVTTTRRRAPGTRRWRARPPGRGSPRAPPPCRAGRRGTTPARGRGESRRVPPRPAVAARGVPARISPPRPTSPKATRSAGSGRLTTAEASARARARSAAGSTTRMPPTAEAKTSVRPSGTPARCSSTASNRARRPASTPWAERRLGASPLARRSERLHLDQQSPLALDGREHRAPGRSRTAVAEEQPVGVGHRRQCRCRPSRTARARRWGRSGVSRRAPCAGRGGGRPPPRAPCPRDARAPGGRRASRPW